MAVSKQRRNLAYGVSNPLQNLSPEPIISSRAPKTSDKAELGTIWVYKSTNASYVLASIVANSATWTPLTVNAGATIATGNLTVTAGNIAVTAGNITLAAGGITATLGSISAGAALSSGTTITAGAGLTVTAGGALISAGDIDVTVGNINMTDGTLTLTDGDIDITLGDINMTDGDLALVNGGIDASLDVRGRQLVADGDDAGTALTTKFTNVVDITLSTGAGVVLMKTVNAGDSSGWMKIYVGADVRYIPFWTNLSP